MTIWKESFVVWIIDIVMSFDSIPSGLGRPALKDGKLEDEVEDETGLKYLYKHITSDCLFVRR